MREPTVTPADRAEPIHEPKTIFPDAHGGIFRLDRPSYTAPPSNEADQNESGSQEFGEDGDSLLADSSDLPRDSKLRSCPTTQH